jgi:hypothetical protein
MRAELVQCVAGLDGGTTEEHRRNSEGDYDHHELWRKSDMTWQGYTKKARPVAGGALSSGDDEEYVENAKSARDAILETRTGSLVEFLDVFVCELKSHVSHRVLQEQIRSAQKEWHRNRRPGDGVAKNMDFSENADVKNARQLQSEHWRALQFTLFISIYDWLDEHEWNKEHGELPVGAEVTVYGEKLGQEIVLEGPYTSYWGKVKTVLAMDHYEIENGNGELVSVHRKRFATQGITLSCFRRDNR